MNVPPPLKSLLLLSLGMAFTSSSQADETPIDALLTIEEVVVRVTRSDRSTFDSPFSVTAVDEASLRDQLVRSMPEALAGQPGVMVQKTANGQGSPFIRGFTGYRTLAMIDGIRYNNSVYRDGPNEYFSLIDFNSLQSIELLAGPAAVAYGSDAIGGALNLQTKSADFRSEDDGERFWHGSQSYRYASAEHSHLSRTELQLGVGAEWGLQLGYSHKNFGDIDATELGQLATTGYDEWAGDVRLDRRINDHWQLTAAHQQLAQDDVWRTHSTVYSVPFAGTEAGSDLRRLKDQQRQLNYLRLEGEALSGWYDHLTVTLSQQNWQEQGDRVKANGERIDDFFDSTMTGFELQLRSSFESLVLTYGVDYYADRVDSGRRDFNADGSLNAVRIQGPVGDDAEFDIYGGYIQAEWQLADRWFVNAGSRYSQTRAVVGAYQDPQSGEFASYRNHWGALANSLRLSHQLSSATETGAEWNLWAGLSQSFRAPNIADLSRFGKSRSSETEVAATNLQPEEFLTFEVGAKARWDDVSITATAYLTDIDNFITSTPTGRIVDGLTEVSKQNSADGEVLGTELTGLWQLSDSVSVTGNITWLRGDLSGYPELGSSTLITEPMSRIMPLTANLGFKWRSSEDRYWLRVDGTWADRADRLSSADQHDVERIPVGGTPSYVLINIYSGWRVNDHCELTLGLANALDEAYRSHGSGTNEPGRGVKLGVTLSI